MLTLPILLALALLAPDNTQRFEDVQLSVDLSGLDAFERHAPAKGDAVTQAWWTGQLGASQVRLVVRTYSNEVYGVGLPEDLIRITEHYFDGISVDEDRTSSRAEGAWRFDSQRLILGPYGYAPYAIVAEKHDKAAKPPRTVLCMAGVAKLRSYTIEVLARPPLAATDRATLLAFLEHGVRYDGEVYDREWAEEEVLARWKRDAPEDLVDDLDVYRTKHFLILTNSSGRKKFAKELEKSYDAIKHVYPFEEREELRLLPVFLFRTADQYYDFCVKTVGWTREGAAKSKGFAWHDFYATWYEAPKDPVHVHELTHQLFENRLHLGGGGSWFQEGVAEFMSTSKTDRKAIKRLVKNSKYAPFPEFFTRASLLGSSDDTRLDGTSPAREAYLQAACIIQFVQQSKWSKGKLQEFIHAVGRIPYGDLEAIEAALQQVFGVGVAGFEEEFVKYWSRR